MNKREMAKRLREWTRYSTSDDDSATCEAAAAALKREAEAEEKAAADAAAMPAEEVAKQLREVRDGVGYPGPIWARAADAFIAKVESKKQAAAPAVKPKVTLKQMAAACRKAADGHELGEDGEHAQAAESTLLRLAQDGRNLTRWCLLLNGGRSAEAYYAKDVDEFLRSLGVEIIQ